MQHGLAVLEHVRDARRRTRVVFEHEEIVFAGAHDVDADDVAIDASRRFDANHFRHERRILDHEFFGDAAGLQDLLAMVDVVHEGVQRTHPLLDAGLQAAPLFGCDNAWQHVERDQPLAGIIGAVDGEGDAGAAEQGFGLCRFDGKRFDALDAEPLGKSTIGRADTTAGAVHFIEG